MIDIKKIINSNYFRLIIFGVVNLLVAYFYIKKPFLTCSDHGTYLKAADYILGNPCTDCGNIPFFRMLTIPLMLVLSLFFSLFTSTTSGGFLIVNLFFYFAIIVLFYKLVLLLFKNSKIALFATILMMANYYFFSYCKAYLSDLGGHFFFLLTNFFAFKYYFDKNKKYFYYAIAASVIGVFFKEFGALGMMTLGMLILFSEKNLLTKTKEIIWAAVLFLLIPVLYHAWFFFQFDFFYLDWYRVGVDNYNTAQVYNPVEMIKVLGWLFLPGWPIFAYALWQVKKFFTKEQYIMTAAMLPASLAFFAWPVFMQRTAFVLVPWLAIVTAFGLSKMKWQWLASGLLLFYIIINYHIEYLLKVINLPL